MSEQNDVYDSAGFISEQTRYKANEFNNPFMMSSPTPKHVPTTFETLPFSLSVFAEAAEAKVSRQSQRIWEMAVSPALMCAFA